MTCGRCASAQARPRGGHKSRMRCENAITMQHLILRPGPQLVMRAFRPETDDMDSRLNEVDVTGRAHQFLSEPITIHAETTLADIFRLMEARQLLQKLYRRGFAEALSAQARKGSVEPSFREQAAHAGMEDLPEERRKKGERIEWSVSLTPLRELLSLPIRFKAEVRITEEDAAAKAYMSEIRRARCADETLGQVIHGLLWELSLHGGPHEQLEVSDDLKRRVAEVDAGTVERVSADDFFEPLYKPGCDALLVELGGRSTREIAAAIRDIDEDQNAAAWLERAFEGAVVVKPQFRNRSSREFRKAFRAAGR